MLNILFQERLGIVSRVCHPQPLSSNVSKRSAHYYRKLFSTSFGLPRSYVQFLFWQFFLYLNSYCRFISNYNVWLVKCIKYAGDCLSRPNLWSLNQFFEGCSQLTDCSIVWNQIFSSYFWNDWVNKRVCSFIVETKLIPIYIKCGFSHIHLRYKVIFSLVPWNSKYRKVSLG